MPVSLAPCALRYVAQIVAAAFVLALLLLVLPASAHAVQNAVIWTGEPLVFDASDSCWYPADDNGYKTGADALFRQIDDRAYPLKNGTVDRSKDKVLTTRFYEDGELVFQLGEWEHPSKLENGCPCVLAGNGTAWFRNDERTMQRLAQEVTTASFDASLLRQDASACIGTSVAGWLAGLESCTNVQGIENLRLLEIRSCAAMFKGCAHLAELDLSALDLGACTDFGSLFEGCSSLQKLVLGDFWTQAAAQGQGGALAAFPLDMSFTIAGRRTVYKAGSTIPNGFGTYLSVQQDLSSAQVVLLAPGSVAVQAAKLAESGWSGAGLPATVHPEDAVVFSDIGELQPRSVSQLEYTGSPLEPTVVVQYAGQVLEQGVHYNVSYAGNTGTGTAEVHIEGIGVFRGSASARFSIFDTAAYVFLYSDGTLALQAGHVPVAGLASKGAQVEQTLRWFDAQSTWADKAQVPWNSLRSDIKRVAIDKSFKAFRLKTLNGWFEGCAHLASFSGMGSIDGSQLVDARNMFKGCAKLATLDASGFYSAHLENMSGMFAGCSSLSRIVVDGSWQNVRAKSAAATFPCTMLRVGGGYERYSAGAPVPSGAGEYRTGGFALQLATVTMEKPAFACTGKAIKPSLEVKVGKTLLVEGKDYTLKYANNILPGKATVTVMGKGAFTGGLVVPFTIRDAVTAVGDRLVYRTKKADYTLVVLEVKKTKGRTVPVRLGIMSVKVKSSSTTKLVLPDTCTVSGVSVDVTAVDSKLGGNFRNVSCVVIGAKVTVIQPKAFSKAPKVKKLQLKTKRLKKAKNALKGSKVKRVTATCKLTKKKRSSYKKMFEKKAGKKNVKFKYAYKA